MLSRRLLPYQSAAPEKLAVVSYPLFPENWLYCTPLVSCAGMLDCQAVVPVSVPLFALPLVSASDVPLPSVVSNTAAGVPMVAGSTPAASWPIWSAVSTTPQTAYCVT